MAVTLYDILGIERTLTDGEKLAVAAALWPSRKVHFLLGDIGTSTPVNPLIQYLQNSLVFKFVLPGAAGDTIGLYAEVEISDSPDKVPLVIRTMPDVAFYLVKTEPVKPARVYVTHTTDGTELVLEALPVMIELPTGLIEPLEQTGAGNPPFPLTNDFTAGLYDSFKVVIESAEPTRIFVHVKIRMTIEQDFIIEPAVVMSVGPCIFSGLPVYGLHDISLIPAPTLKGEGHEKVEQAIEWTRHTIEPSESLLGGDTNFRGVIAVRTVDLDPGLTPLKELNEWINSGQTEADLIQFVLEDVVIPFFNIALSPLPIHGRIGIRRNIEAGNNFQEWWSFASAPVKIQIAGFLLLIDEFIIESVDTSDIENNQFARVKMIITRGDVPKSTTISGAINAQAVAINVADPTAFTDLTEETALVIDRVNPAAREIITVTGINGTTLTGVKRGQNGTKAVDHKDGDSIQTDTFANHAVTIGFADEWTAQAGWRLAKGWHLTTIGDNQIKLMGAKAGFSFKRLYQHTHGTHEFEWYEFWQLLADLNFEVKPSTNKTFRIEFLSQSFQANPEPVNVSWPDVGYKFGSLALGGIQLPEGTQIVIANFLKVILQEIAVVTEKNGGTYFSITGGLGLGGEKYGASLVVYRFRWKIAGNENAGQWALDGITFYLKIKSFELLGAGMVGEFNIDNHLYKEMQFGLDLKCSLFGKSLQFGIFLYKGEVSGPVDNFKYRMFAFSISFVPAVGGIDLYNIRFLGANNLAPNLAPPDSSDQNLRVFKWYKTSSSPLGIPDGKKLNAWRPQDDSFAIGLGAAAGIGGTKALLLDLFAFLFESPTEKALMIAMDVFLLKSRKPVGFAVVEVDFENDKWAIFIGVSLSFNNVLPEGTDVPGLNDVAALSGNLYIGNKPGTFALGQLGDQNTWFGFRMKEERFFKMDLVVAMCIHFVDRPEGPKGFGGLISAKGGASFGVGKAEFYISFVLIAGIWKNESSSSGLIIVFEAGFRIKLFRVFNFGAGIKIQLDFLGPDPEYRHLAFEIHIDTPWYLPDVTIRWDKVFNQPTPEQQPLFSTAVISGEALQRSSKEAVKLLVTALEGPALDEKQLFHMSQLRALSPQSMSQQALTDMKAVSVDSTIAVNFKPPVDDQLTIGENTPAGAGTQAPVAPATGEMSVTYELITLSIRRQPLYGPNALQWTTLLAPENTTIPPIDSWPSTPELQALFSSEVKVSWDRDVQAENRLDPRRLLINAETPFTLVTQNAQADESILIHQAGWPCCNGFGTGKDDKWRTISYDAAMAGQRTPVSQEFTDSHSTLRWMVIPRPLVITANIPSDHPPAAKVNLNTKSSSSFTIAVISFDQPAARFRMLCYWIARIGQPSIIVDCFKGLDLLSSKAFPLSGTQNGFIEADDDRGITRIVLRVGASQELFARIANPRTYEGIEIVKLQYKTIADQQLVLAGTWRCQNGEGNTLSGKGKLAWLPNHNYELTLTTRAKLDHNQSGVQDATMVQRVYFRTKGMIGLNAAEYVGQEIEPYVESTYADRDHPIVYREEPVAIAFTEQFNILMPVDRSTDPASSAELTQVLEWDLTVDKEADPDGRNRVTRSSADWIVENRGTGTTNPFDFTILVATLLSGAIRKALSLDIQRQRLNNILASPVSCNGGTASEVPSSLVLLHQPIDTSRPEPRPLWQADTAYKANLKAKGGPCIHRSPFAPEDVTAFKPFTDNGFSGGAWAFDSGAIVPGQSADPATRYYALFGESDWNHVEVGVELAVADGCAGIAIGVQSSASGIIQGLMAVIDGPGQLLKVQRRLNGVVTDLEQAAVVPNEQGVYRIDAIAYDDVFEVRVGDARLLVERSEIREGQLGLVAQHDGRFTRLSVESLDAYTFSFRSSRYVGFEDHIRSLNNTVAQYPASIIPADIEARVNSLYATSASQIATLMTLGGDSTARQDLFDTWINTVELPLTESPGELTITRSSLPGGTPLLLLESPEPLPFARDVQLTIEKDSVIPDPGLSAGDKTLESMIPTAFQVLEQKIPAHVRGVRTLTISKTRADLSLDTTFIQSPGQPPRFALAAVPDADTIRYFLFELQFGPVSFRTVPVRATLRLFSHFNSLTQRPLVKALREALDGIQPSQVLLLNAQGQLIKVLTVAELTLSGMVAQHFALLSNGNACRTLIIPLTGINGTPATWGAGKYHFRFSVSRQRYRQDTPDGLSEYVRDTVQEVEW